MPVAYAVRVGVSEEASLPDTSMQWLLHTGIVSLSV